jgi:hypothetical protein
MDPLVSNYEFIFQGAFNQSVYDNCSIILSPEYNSARQILVEAAVVQVQQILQALPGVNTFSTFIEFADENNVSSRYKITYSKN